jgi:hypothetical protein
MAGSYRRPVPPELLPALFAAVAVSIWRMRRSRVRAAKLEADIAQRVHRHEIPKVNAPMRLANRKFNVATLDFLKILGMFALSILVTTLFLAGFPLHAYWRPWGPITGAVSFFFLILMLIDGTRWVGEVSSWNYSKKAYDFTHKGLKQ